MFDYLQEGDSLNIFLADFPSVTREQASGVLELMCERLLTDYETVLDECTPQRLKADFTGHDVLTVNDVGLRGVKNGELLPPPGTLK